MKKSILILIIAFLAAFPAAAEELGPNNPGPEVCLPGRYHPHPEKCLFDGPEEELSRDQYMREELARQSQFFTPLDPDYGEVNYAYAKVHPERGRIYRSVEAAYREGQPHSYIRPGYNFVTYNDIVQFNGQTFYNVGPSQYMRAEDITGHVEPTGFTGVLVNGAPERPFGWVLVPTVTREIPGRNTNSLTGHELPRHHFIQVFDTRRAGGWDWYLVAPGEWVEQRQVALVFPRAAPPEGVPGHRYIELNLFEQTTAVYDRGKLVFATLTTSGSAEYYTRPGLFKIWEKRDVTHMRGGVEKDGSDRYYLEDIPWTMFFDQGRAFHGEYWHDHLGYRSSHGCANLSFSDARWLYEWAKLGDWVYVWDPSGQTPVDPRLYTHLLDDEPRSTPRYLHPDDSFLRDSGY
jgi:hypothetical protein